MPDPTQNNIPDTTPPTPTPPAPPAGALDTGVTGADPANALMAEAVRLGGPLGGVAMGAATGAAHHIESQNQPQSTPQDMTKDPQFLALPQTEQHQLLSAADPDYGKLQPNEQQAILAGINRGVTRHSNPLAPSPVTVKTPEQQAQSELVAPAAHAPIPKPIEYAIRAVPAMTAGGAVAEAVGGGLAGSVLSGAAAGGTQSVTDQLLAGENPFRLEMMKQTAADTAMGAATGGVLHGAGEIAGNAANRLKNAVLPSGIEEAGELTEGHFQRIPKEQTPQDFPHGPPVVGDQPLTNAAIGALRQGRTLGTEEVNLLKQYVGDTIESGSSPKNTIMRAVAPVNENINRLGLQMNKIIQDAPDFAQSAIEDEAIGTPLREDLQNMKESLPHGASGEKAEIITKQLAAENEALTKTNPQEILAARRKLGDKIDWDKPSNNPDTDAEVQNAARKRIYSALSDKLKQIEGLSEIDQEFQPNLELRGWLDKILPKGLAYDPIEADAQRVIEHNKGVRKIAIDAHNARVDRNYKIAGAALAAAGYGYLKHSIPAGVAPPVIPPTP